MVQQFGGAFGTALVVVVLTVGSTGRESDAGFNKASRRTIVMTMGN